MVTGDDEPTEGDDGPILSPDELDITQDEHVAEIDDGRYVVSPGEPIGDTPAVDDHTSAADRPPETPPEPAAEPAAEPPELTEADVHEFLATQFSDSGSRYGFDITATFDGSIRQRQMVSNDVVTIFESLVLWYAQQIDGKTPVEEVLGILLMEANVPVRYPPASLRRLLESTELSPEDSIADLIAAVGDEDGFRI
ncbi:hypothetical protein HZS55_19545 [Halosimplex rubrum]|uniref:DIX domain-containing protein n=1 Tax=Halosimplex rubrum TaxID=869889 RepID=A0A7D5TR31_9EURY|nr:hypothetical protein [Halosimplex rubrum]QLH79354.1 hypothetical protein HZS55_19545 [Halosimplex rubrum]